MINVICGGLGSGKTLYAMEVMEHALAQGKVVGSNISLTAQCPFADKVVRLGTDQEPIMDAVTKADRKAGVRARAFWHTWWKVGYFVEPGACIIIDEAALVFECTKFSEMGDDLFEYLVWNRKLKHDLYFIAQKPSHVYNRIRALCQRFIFCYNKARTDVLYRNNILPKSWALFERGEFDDEKMEPEDLIGYGAISHKEASARFGWYDTKELLGNVGRWAVGYEEVMATVKARAAAKAGAVAE